MAVQKKPGNNPPSFWPVSVGSTPNLMAPSATREKETNMEKQKRGATARALIGLVNDLTDEQLLVLTASENRPVLKNVLQNPQTIAGSIARKESSFGLVGITVAKKFVVASGCFKKKRH
jgi:hypothetical protein